MEIQGLRKDSIALKIRLLEFPTKKDDVAQFHNYRYDN